jgi:hypothetical protein
VALILARRNQMTNQIINQMINIHSCHARHTVKRQAMAPISAGKLGTNHRGYCHMRRQPLMQAALACRPGSSREALVNACMHAKQPRCGLDLKPKSHTHAHVQANSSGSAALQAACDRALAQSPCGQEHCDDGTDLSAAALSLCLSQSLLHPLMRRGAARCVAGCRAQPRCSTVCKGSTANIGCTEPSK